MAQLILTRNSQFHRALRTRSAFPLSLRVGRFFLLFSLTLMIGVLSFFYLVKSTEIQTRGFQLQRLEIEKNNLVTAVEGRNTEIARLKSLNAVRESDITSSMVPARSPIFIKKGQSFASAQGGSTSGGKATAGKPPY